ncbi:hypothetical protein [Meiothermus sp. CFH 77666]|uniref:hypothetical protein n=1 Tax=Meiothermus sp. CFH 77666 TaxID=2817942 RepID=UPI001AA07831|nr:hypothetical protein [Meiothermus sp. CFH 77666]MBO1438237.1 hypothetical protein [Meiothermus sp. CFH 77666]
MNRLIFDLLDIAAIIPSLGSYCGDAGLVRSEYPGSVFPLSQATRPAIPGDRLQPNRDFIDSDEYAFSLLGLPVFLASSVFLLWLVWALLLNLK